MASFRVLIATMAVMAVVAPAQAQVCGTDKEAVSRTRDRCLAKSIEVDTREGWRSVYDGDELCFQPDRHDWRWQCRGQVVTEECRISSNTNQKFNVKVTLRNGTVRWSCFRQ